MTQFCAVLSSSVHEPEKYQIIIIIWLHKKKDSILVLESVWASEVSFFSLVEAWIFEMNINGYEKWAQFFDGCLVTVWDESLFEEEKIETLNKLRNLLYQNSELEQRSNCQQTYKLEKSNKINLSNKASFLPWLSFLNCSLRTD